MSKRKPKPASRFADCNLYGPSVSTPEGIEQASKGIIRDGRRYLGGGAWELVDHEASETNERREGRQ